MTRRNGLACTSLFIVLAGALAGCSDDADASGQSLGGGTGAGTSGGTSTGGAGGLGAGAMGAGGAGAGTAVGGSPGAGGSGAGGTGAGGSTGGGSTLSPDAILFEEDFEAGAPGSLPTGSWTMPDPSCGSFVTELSTEQVKSGGQAMKFTNHRYASCRLSTPIPEADDFWLRYYVYYDGSMDFSGKELLALELIPDSGLNKDDPSVRFGSRTKAPCTMMAGPQVTIIGLGGGEVTGCSGTPMPQGRWVCMEAHVTQSASIKVERFIDGSTEPLGLGSVGKPTLPYVETEGASAEKVKNVRIGIFANNSSADGDVYVDGIVMATERVGCE